MSKHRTEFGNLPRISRGYQGRHVDTDRQPGNQDRVNTTPDKHYDDSSNDRSVGERKV